MTDEELIATIKNHFTTKNVSVENMGMNYDKTNNILIVVRNARRYKDIKNAEEMEYLKEIGIIY